MKIPWVTLAAVGFGLWASLAPGVDALLEYERAAVRHGDLWRLVTSHFVHWTPRMTIMDLGAMLVLGSLLELRSRRLALATLAGAILVIGPCMHFLLLHVALYRGASGVDSALFAAVALEAFRWSDASAVRWAVAGALLVFVLKVAWEAATGEALAAGPLSEGIRVAPSVHLLGASAGGLVWLLLAGPGRLAAGRMDVGRTTWS